MGRVPFSIGAPTPSSPVKKACVRDRVEKVPDIDHNVMSHNIFLCGKVLNVPILL